MDNNVQPTQNGNNPMAIAGLVLGIVSVVFSFLYVWIGLIAGVVGIILSVKGRKIQAKKGMATAGLVLSIVGVCLSGILVACALCVVGTVGTAISTM